MARVPLVDLGDAGSDMLRAGFRRFTNEDREPIALYRALGNAPGLLVAYGELVDALLDRGSTPRSLRELAILRVAHVTGSDYEWTHHRWAAEKCGLADAKVRDLIEWEHSSAFDLAERALLECVDEMAGEGLTDEAFRALAGHFDTVELVELIGLVAMYLGIARMIDGLGVAVEPEYETYRGLPQHGCFGDG
jgi:4-carboxymuconolactone decarboxylase